MNSEMVIHFQIIVRLKEYWSKGTQEFTRNHQHITETLLEIKINERKGLDILISTHNLTKQEMKQMWWDKQQAH